MRTVDATKKCPLSAEKRNNYTTDWCIDKRVKSMWGMCGPA
jgi:hypothetical protein